MGVVFLIVIIIIAVWVLASCIRIVPQAYAVILERLGAYQATWSTGIHFKIPFIERVARKVNLHLPHQNHSQGCQCSFLYPEDILHIF